MREALGSTQQELAERIGLGQRQVSKIERGDLDSTKFGTVRK
ncbi:helix-turn-helix transcriptional regulator [Microbacterium sp.]|nr:helix-turn-helix transcriptional regulator [Microbacterium sp.]